MKDFRITVITPSFNQAQFLEATILSVISQDYPNIEYLIMDGGSSDGSVKIIQKYTDRIHYWESQPDSGQADAINKGLQKSSGEIVGWINSDDVLEPGTIRRIVDHFTQNPGVDLTYGEINYIDDAGKIIEKRKKGNSLDFSLQTMLLSTNLAQPGSFWRRSVLAKIGYLDTSYHHIMDYEYWVRLALHGGVFSKLPSPPIANFRVSSNTKTSSQLDKSGQETFRLLGELTKNNLLQTKLLSIGIEQRHIVQQINICKSYAALKMFYGLSLKAKCKKSSLSWLASSVKLSPTLMLTRYRMILKGLTNLLLSRN